ncbi:DUF2235 domain-containing protein [Pseudovibrio sp. Ad26]|uniref:T6SS phospholipase effector Tle1-like catalytic domain-containing protein n=1 Tax=Pseudovibrio sp. Ad26 TaxID=989410 RepID=UPI0007AEA614|nr:DUF2235 domain-containing protein [Pseudovibrio sp. Ad26]KZL15279.1 hypothetical protein PsAD26_01120 [Pseudovibrio sp. Ad26]
MSNNFPDKSVSSCEVCDFVLRIGVFFDGTGNNQSNVRSKKISDSFLYFWEGDDSYKSDFTNIWKLHNLYPQQHSQRNINEERYIFGNYYVEGIGTENNEPDSKYGAGLGTGDSGVIAKSEKGASQAFNFVSTYAGYNIIRIEVDVFGFSRGAAAARHFSNLVINFKGIYSPYHWVFKEIGPGTVNMSRIPARNMVGKKRIRKEHNGELYSIFEEIPVEIQFIGLFDTVPSVIDLLDGDISAQNDDNGDVLTHLPSGIAQKKVVQLAAINERRENFGLKSILSSPVSCKNPEVKIEGNHLEECMFGAHSDIGGGYVSKAYGADLGVEPDAAKKALDEGWIGEKLAKKCSSKTTDKSYRHDGYPIGQSLTEETCIIEGETGKIIEETSTTTTTLKDIGTSSLSTHKSTLQREYVDGAYSRIALHKMHDYAVASEVPFIALNHEDGEGSKEANPIPELTDIPDELKFIDEKIHKGEPLSDDELKLLKKKYLHHSDNYEGIGHDPHESGERLIFPN